MSSEEITHHAALRQVSARIGLSSASSWVLIRRGTNAVYRNPECAVIARIHLNGPGYFNAGRAVRIAKILARDGVSAARPLDIDQPLTLQGLTITLWDEAPGQPGAHLDCVAALIHAFRESVSRSCAHILPRDQLPDAVDTRLTVLENSAPGLREYWTRLRAENHNLSFRLSDLWTHREVVHGDVQPSNFLHHSVRSCILLDLDGVRLGPSQLDTWRIDLAYISGDLSQASYVRFYEILGESTPSRDIAELFVRFMQLALTSLFEFRRLISGDADTIRKSELMRQYWCGMLNAPPTKGWA